jgi:hypothetical protein
LLLTDLARDAAMIVAFGGSDAEGAWDWKTASEACEVAQILFLRKFGPAMRDRAASPARFLGKLAKLAALLPSHTRRSEESQALQQFTDVLYEGYALQSIRISGSKAHPTQLVQSAAMASVSPPKPSYRPHLPADLVSAALLSDAQLESVIYAGEVHSGYFAGSWTVDDTFDVVSAAPDEGDDAVRFGRGWFLGDGTGAGMGREVAGIILDNWLKGCRRALWISESDN